MVVGGQASINWVIDFELMILSGRVSGLESNHLVCPPRLSRRRLERETEKGFLSDSNLL